MRRGYLALLAVVALSAGGLGYGLSHPSVPPVDGIECAPMEAEGFHIHVHLQLWKSGQELPVPAGIGFASGCFYWLHTHTNDGIVHLEAPHDGPYTLGQFFAIWGQRAPEFGTQPQAWVDRGDGRGFQRATGDWRQIVLTDRAQIVLGSGEFTPRPVEFPQEL